MQHGPKLTSNQKSILAAYFQAYIEAPMVNFIKVVHSTVAKELRAGLVFFSTKLKPKVYLSVLSKYYPPGEFSKGDSAKIIEQKAYFASVLGDINAFCKGHVPFDHNIYQDVFDTRFSPHKLTVEARKNLVSLYFIKKVQNWVQDQGYPLAEFEVEVPFQNPHLASLVNDKNASLSPEKISTDSDDELEKNTQSLKRVYKQ